MMPTLSACGVQWGKFKFFVSGLFVFSWPQDKFCTLPNKALDLARETETLEPESQTPTPLESVDGELT